MQLNELSEKYLKTDEERKEFAEYTANKFTQKTDEKTDLSPFAEKWKEIMDLTSLFGAAGALNTAVSPKRPTDFRSPEKVKIAMYDSFCGEIMIVSIADTQDFENFITNAVYRGVRPDDLSETGAAFISGKKIRFIALSAKPYSNVPAEEIGLSDEDWAQKSLILRRGHECTHYYTKCVYGRSENNLHDELMADFFGVYEAFGYFRAELMLRFFGLEGSSGNRLKFYTGSLCENTRRAVYEAARTCALNLEEWSKSAKFSAMTRVQRTDALCRAGIEGIFSGEISI